MSRMNVFEIPTPDDSAKKVIAESIYNETREEKEWGKLFAPEISQGAMEKLMEYSPREMRKAISAGFGNAHLDGRREILSQDIPRKHHLGSGKIGFF